MTEFKNPDMPTPDPETLGAFSDTKPNLAVWDYQNTGEDFERRILLNLDPVKGFPEEARAFIVSIIDNTVKSLTNNYDIVPKDPANDNKVTQETNKLLGILK